MKLSERKRKILSAVVDESIRTAEPVSSKDVQEKYLSDLSPATIRNELMALEEMGFLLQPHTSAGRMPTAEGYKMYVEQLMPDRKLSKKEAAAIKENFDTHLFNLDDVLQQAAKTISDATNYASVAVQRISNEAEIENIVLVQLTKSVVMVVVATDLGTIKKETNKIVASTDELRQANKILNSVFRGKKLQDVENGSMLITKELARYKQIFDYIVQIITERDDNKHNMAVVGKDKLLNYPEYQDYSKLKGTINLLSQEDKLYSLVNSQDGIEISVKIGEGGGNDAECSIVTTSLRSKGKSVGSLSVVGPMRMDYSKVVSVLKNMTKLLENSNIFKEDQDE